jgi:hypothetical protein
MKLRFKEDPKEWRKSALMTALGLAILSSILRWRHVLPAAAWCAVLAVLAVAAVSACLQPGWFRGYYRWSLRLGFGLSQFIGRAVLLIVFLLIVTPMGLLLRLAGKDSLQLKRPRTPGTYWRDAKEHNPLDRLF